MAGVLRNSQSPILWTFLGLSLLLPLIVAVGWGGIYADAAYEQFQQAHAISAGQSWDLRGFSPLYTLLLALADFLHLPLLPIATMMSVLGWMTAIIACFLTGLTLDRPTFSIAVAVLLTLHPLQGRVLGLEQGFVLGLMGLATWWVARGRVKTALVAALILLVTQPLTNLSPESLWNTPRLTTPLLAVLDVLIAAGFAFLVPDLDWLTSPVLDRHALKKGFCVLGLAALAFGQGRALAQDWWLRPTDRPALYETLAQWLQTHALPTETIATQHPGLMGHLSQRATMPLPQADQASASSLVHALERERPDYCIALNSLAWRGVRAQPWFQEHYAEMYQIASPYDASTPLILFRYAPTPFDAGKAISTTATFVVDESTGEQFALAGYRLDSQRITPGEPLHLTLYWQATTVLRQSLSLTVRLFDPATEETWVQIENPVPGGLATDLWNDGAQFDDRYTLLPPADMPPGEYVLDVMCHLPNGRSLAVRADDGTTEKAVETRLTLTQVSRPPSVSTAPLTPDHPFNATFGSVGEIELSGYDAVTRISPGDTLRVALYWYVRQPVPLNYKVFVHLLFAQDKSIVLAQGDGLPVAWTYPTVEWQPGEAIRDEHLLVLPSSAPRGDYWLVVGMYDSATGERAIVRDADGNEIAGLRVTLQQVQVR
ncbi:MAG: hypothetical protein GY832_07995 [Chloroflexi bacterium]|nr:hypothetical protein [Chloroflexota bacterium]